VAGSGISGVEPSGSATRASQLVGWILEKSALSMGVDGTGSGSRSVALVLAVLNLRVLLPESVN
jgi:hypothetical protein